MAKFWPFGNSKKPPRKYKTQPRDPEKEARKAAYNNLAKELREATGDDRRELIGLITGLKLKPRETKSIEDEIFEEACREDPEFRNAVKQAKLMQIKGVEESNPTEDLRTTIQQAAIEAIQQDPDLRDRAIGGEIQRLMGGRKGGGGVLDAFEELERYEAIRERLSQRESGSEERSWLQEAFKQIPSILGYLSGNPQGSGKQEIYIVPNPDGSHTRMTRSQYFDYQKEQKRLPSDTGSRETHLIVPKDEEEPEPTEKPQLKTHSLNMKSWLTYLDAEPQDFVYILQENASSGDEQAGFALEFLSTHSIEEVKNLLSAFQNTVTDEETRMVIDRILSEEKAGWLEEVLLMARSLFDKLPENNQNYV